MTTAEHPFYTAEGEWVDASELEAGDEIRTAEWGTGVVASVYAVTRPEEMYNFTVGVAHTYFVGEQEWLVHNATNVCPPRFLIHFTGEWNYKNIQSSNFTMRPSAPEKSNGGTPKGIFFGDAEPTDFGGFSEAEIMAQWGPQGGQSHFIMIDTQKLPEDISWHPRLMHFISDRPEWVMATDVPYELGDAVVKHGPISLLER